MVVGPDWKGETPPGIKKVFRVHHAVLAGDLPHPALQPGRHAQCGEGPGRLQGAAALGLSEAAGAARCARRSTSRRSTRNWSRRTSSSTSTSPCSSRPPGRRKKEIRAKLARIGIGPGKTFDFKDLSLEHKAEIGLGMKDGEKKVEAKSIAIGKDINGWKIGSRLRRPRLLSTATGCSGPLAPRPASTATTPLRPCIR